MSGEQKPDVELKPTTNVRGRVVNRWDESAERDEADEREFDYRHDEGRLRWKGCALW